MILRPAIFQSVPDIASGMSTRQKIIHGRGLRSPQGPVLKNAVISFLSSRYRKRVIGFATARKNDGGLGALYVLLA